MFKRVAVFAILCFAAINLCGCIVLAAQMLAPHKVTQNVDASYVEALKIVEDVFVSEGIKLDKAQIKPNMAIVKGIYTDGRTVYIQVFRVSENKSRIDIRTGTSEASREDAQTILDAVRRIAEQNK